MSRETKKGKKSIVIRRTAQRLIANIPEKAWLREVKALHAFVRDKIRYTKDIRGVETIHSPEKILEFGQGDCDDKSILLASLLESIGHPTRFVAVGFRPSSYSHVLVETRIGNKWLPLETTERVNVGWYPKGVKIRLVRHN